MKKVRIAALACLLLCLLNGCGQRACGHTATVVQNRLEATCTRDGYSGDVFCEVCGEQLQQGTVIPAAGHVLRYHGTVNATCTQPGSTGAGICDVCGELLAENLEILPLGHVPQRLNEKQADCRSDGYTGDVICYDCGEVLSRGEVIPAGEHIPTTSNAVAQTCTQAGYTGDVYCASCGEQLSEGTVTPAGHTEVTRNMVAATCQQEGYSGDVFCGVCGEQLRGGSSLLKTDHVPIVKNAASPTCTTPGYSGDTFCSVCGLQLSQGAAQPARNHANTELRNAREATMESEGYTGDTYCTDCGMLLTAGEVIERQPSQPSTVASTSYSSDGGLAQSMFNDINAQRMAAGYQPLTWDSSLVAAATIRANEYRTWAVESRATGPHERLDGRNFASVFAETGSSAGMYTNGENLAGNSFPGQMVSAWMGSEGHRANILRGEFTHGAIAVIYDGNAYWACNLFWG